jgi:hypothetical protein
VSFKLVSPVALAVIAAALVTAAPAPRDARDQDIYVAVTGPDDKPVRDLTVQDFIVREDDRAREVLRVAPAPPASHITLLVDDSAASVSAMPHVRTALLDLSRYLLALPSPPQLSIVTFGERPTERSAFTTHTSVIQSGIGKLFPISNAGAYFLEALVELGSDAQKRQLERPAIIAFVADDGPEFSSAGRREVTTALQRGRATLWAIVLQKGTPNVTSKEWQERTFVVNEVAAQSGGASRTILTDLGVGPAFTWVATLLTSQYRVTYSRPDTLIPPTRVSVDVRRPNVRVAARRWAAQ